MLNLLYYFFVVTIDGEFIIKRKAKVVGVFEKGKLRQIVMRIPLIDMNACFPCYQDLDLLHVLLFFPTDDGITHPPPDCFLDFVPSVAILTRVPS